MTNEQRQQILDALAKSTKNDTKSVARARKVLISRGLLTKGGNLPKAYRASKEGKVYA